MKRSSWLKSWLQNSRAFGNRASRRSAEWTALRANISSESLETRSLLAVTGLFIPVSGELSVQCDTSDGVRVSATAQGNVLVEKSINGGPFVPATSIGNVRAANVRSIVVLGGDDQNVIDLGGVTATSFTARPAIRVDGSNGHDTITGSPDLPDSLSGGDGADTIDGQAGNDTIVGGDGDDSITGGDDSDLIRAGDGADSVTGDLGADTIESGDGDDTVSGGDDADSIVSGNGQDLLSGDDGDDTINGDGGSDTITGGLGNDSILGGELNDSISGGDGNDRINAQAGNDTVTGDVGDDILEAGTGNDSVSGNEGNDSVNGGLGGDTIVGNIGDDTIFGGAGDDRLLGDGVDGQSVESGRDSINGQGGSDTIVGGRGSDTLNGGDGRDLVSSFFLVIEAPPPPPAPPIPPTPTMGGGAFTDAVDSGQGVDIGTQSVTLQVGNGDGSLIQDADATGHFDFANTNSSIFNPLGPINAASASFDSTVYIRQGVSGGTGLRQALGAAATNVSTIRLNGLIEANSTFTIGNLTFALTQTLESTLDNQGIPTGSLLTQTYRVTNNGLANSEFELLRYYDGDLRFDGTLVDGGGRLVTVGGEELLFETDAGGTATSTTFVGITGKGGTVPATGRFEIDRYPQLETNIQIGNTLRDRITNDANLDGSVDFGAEYDVSLGFRNLYNIAAGESDVYTTHTVFGTGVPNNIQAPNVTPVATDDVGASLNGAPATIDIVSNDTDTDGILDFTSIRITTLPTNGTVVDLGNGLVTYTPNVGFSGIDSFSYTISDDRATFSNSATVSINVVGIDAENDLLTGGNDNDTLIASLGNDTLNGGGGNDELHGGGGNDLIFGGSGADRLLGENGNDTLDGQGGPDSLDGGDNEDTYVWNGAAGGNDTLFGTEGSDSVSVQGTGKADAISVGELDNFLIVTFGGATLRLNDSAERPSTIVNVLIAALGGDDTLTLNTVSNVGRLELVMDGGEGNDLVDATGAMIGAVRVALRGNNGNDTINGSMNGDTINGGAGDDSCSGNGGNDTMFGELGNDAIGGGLGNDAIDGGEGNDLLNGQKGDDSVFGGSGADTLKGEDGNDSLFGDFGDDTLNGGSGDDSLEGSTGADALVGGAGSDTLNGGRNDDTISGNGGNDKIRGDHGNDYIAAGEDSDTVNGGDGSDTIITLDGSDFVHGGDGNDRINTAGGNDVIVGGDGNDSIQGGGGQDTILGGDGDDSINGQGGTDLIAGQQGADTLDDPLSEINERFLLSAVILQILRAL